MFILERKERKEGGGERETERNIDVRNTNWE